MTGERQTVGCRAMKLVRDLVGELVVLGTFIRQKGEESLPLPASRVSASDHDDHQQQNSGHGRRVETLPCPPCLGGPCSIWPEPPIECPAPSPLPFPGKPLASWHDRGPRANLLGSQSETTLCENRVLLCVDERASKNGP